MRAPTRLAASLIAVLLLAFAGSAWGSGDDRPIVAGEAATEITESGAVLSGTVNPNNETAGYLFEYGVTSAYGSHTPLGSLGKSKSPRPVSAAVAGLADGTTYHYRLVATSKKGTTRGADQTFTTVASPDPGPDPGPGPGDPDPGTDPEPGGDANSPDRPLLGSSVVVAPGEGKLLVRRPGKTGFVPLAYGSELPLGSEIDATAGSIALTSALPGGALQTGKFGGGRFTIRQGKRGYIDLYLRGRACVRTRKGGAIASAARAARKPRSRRLWGRDKGGRFRTHGKNSHATVRGTRWVVRDTCAGTLTRVTEGAVMVRDTVRHKRVLLEAGQRYLARPRG